MDAPARVTIMEALASSKGMTAEDLHRASGLTTLMFYGMLLRMETEGDVVTLTSHESDPARRVFAATAREQTERQSAH